MGVAGLADLSFAQVLEENSTDESPNNNWGTRQ